MAACDSDLTPYIENVDQLVNDESKVVTYDYLSQTSGIHVNVAKQVLEEYARVLKKRGVADSYQFIHSVGGFEGKNLKFFIVPEDGLEHAKSKLDRVLSSHYYSVQKGKLGSLELLYNSNRTGIKPSIEQCSAYSGINCSFVKLKESSGAVPPTSVPSTIHKSADVKPAVAPVLSNQSDNKTNQEAHDGSKSANIKTEKKPMPITGKAGLAAMFAKQAQAPPKKKTEPEEEKKPVANKRIVREPSDDEIENKEEKREKVTSNKRFKLSEEPKQEKKVEPKKTKKASKRSGSLDHSKRRRIQQISDSEDSENEKSENGEEDMIVSSPERPSHTLKSDDEDEDMIAGTPKQSPPHNSKRSRKLVTRQFEDKDGFIVTKKEYVTCEGDEEEPAPEPLPTTTKEINKEHAVKVEPDHAVKKTSPAKTKQKSIISFFTKK